jgi:hypothetical protein
MRWWRSAPVTSSPLSPAAAPDLPLAPRARQPGPWAELRSFWLDQSERLELLLAAYDRSAEGLRIAR